VPALAPPIRVTVISVPAVLNATASVFEIVVEEEEDVLSGAALSVLLLVELLHS